MAKAIFLLDENNQKVYPYAHASATFDSEGNTVEEKISTIETNIEDISEISDNAVQSVKIGSTEYKSGTTVTLPEYPSSISELSEDATHRTVTDAEKITWSGKADASTTISGYGITDAYTKTEIDTELSKKLNVSLKGVSNGLAELDDAGKVPSSQLPSYVDDVLEYNNKSSFPTTGEAGKIYIDKETNVTYRWGGSTYVSIGSDLALGETSSTAYAGDKGKALADKLATVDEGAEVNVQSDWNVTDEESDAFIKNKPTITDTTYTFTQEEHTLKISGTDGTDETITLGSEVTKDNVVNALGFEPNIYIDETDNEDIETESAALFENDVIDSLSVTSANKPLSANQGYILNEKIENKKVDISSAKNNVLTQKDDGLYVDGSSNEVDLSFDIERLSDGETSMYDSYTNYDYIVIGYKGSNGNKLTMTIMCDDITSDDTYQLIAVGSSGVEFGTIMFDSINSFIATQVEIYRIDGVRTAELKETISIVNNILN